MARKLLNYLEGVMFVHFKSGRDYELLQFRVNRTLRAYYRIVNVDEAFRVWFFGAINANATIFQST